MVTSNVRAPALETWHRILPDQPITNLADYERVGGGAALRAAMSVEPDVVLAEIEASGLRGRGGAGFPTGAKWRTILTFASDVLATSVVINAAEGEPGTFKDRALLERNPYVVLEGALIAARVVGARTITIATKARFPQARRVRNAVGELSAAGWNEGVEFTIVEGPPEYLYGEETALLEVIDGRPPFPRIAPPWRRGVVEIVDDADGRVDTTAASGSAADLTLASDSVDNDVPPVLVNNVETFANVPAIVLNGAAWFRTTGTRETPGSLLCTVTGTVDRPGVYEVAAGTPLRDLLEMTRDTTTDSDLAPHDSPHETQHHDPRLVLLGVSNAVLTADQLDVPISHEGFRALGTGLGSASFIVVDAATDPVAAAAGASRFLAVESCGQCTPCKQDGLEIATILTDLADGTAPADADERLEQLLSTVTDGARCSLATQHQVVVGSIRRAFPAEFAARTRPGAKPVEPFVVAELVALNDKHQETDPDFAGKQPDWTYDATDSGKTPVERLADHRAG